MLDRQLDQLDTPCGMKKGLGSISTICVALADRRRNTAIEIVRVFRRSTLEVAHFMATARLASAALSWSARLRIEGERASHVLSGKDW